MYPLAARAIIRGSRVPKSPREPDISARGASRNVVRLWALRRRTRASHALAMFGMTIEANESSVEL